MDKIGAQFFLKRKEVKMTQDEAAKRIGISIPTLRKLENKGFYDENLIKRIEKVYGCVINIEIEIN